MKRFLILPLALAGLATTTFAQTNAAPASGQGQAAASASKAPEGVIKQGGRIALVRAGKVLLLDGALTFPNKLRVDPDGTITHPDKTQAKLMENQMITLAGAVVPMQSGMPTGIATTKDTTQVFVPSSQAAPIKAGEGAGAR